MMLVTAAIDGTGSSPKWLAQLRAASCTGSKLGRLRAYLEHRRFGVRAPHVLQRVDHLALGRVRAGTVDEDRHQVRLTGRGGAQFGELALHLGAVATGPDGLHATDLLALEVGVDAQERRVAVVALRVPVDADHDALAGVDLLLQLERGVRDLSLRIV